MAALMAFPQVQIAQVSESVWQFTRVSERRRDVYKYDILARVVQDEGDKLFYVERSYWDGGKQKWERRPRGYQVYEGAERWASDYTLGNVEEQ